MLFLFVTRNDLTAPASRLLVATAACFVMLSASAQTPALHPSGQFLLMGTITGHDTGSIILQYNNALDELVNDSTTVNQGKFSFKGSLSGPTLAYLIGNIKSNDLDDPNRKLVFLEPCTMNIDMAEGNLKQALITGSKTQDDIEELDRQLRSTRNSINALKAIHQRTPDQIAAYDSLYQQLYRIKYTFVTTHPNSFASPYLMMGYHNAGLSLDSAKKLYSHLSPDVRKSSFGRYFKQEITDEEANAPGHPAADFTRTDMLGHTIRLSAFKGRNVILLDFWGSWCIPCRELSPLIRHLYARYHKKGLEVISISSDIDPMAWKKAIAKDSIGIWTNIGPGHNESSPSKQMEGKYSVTAYPTLVLIDKKGFIVTRFEGFSGDVDDLEQSIQKALGLLR
jgi:thiol-disulfide isomerase/thioredoxin